MTRDPDQVARPGRTSAVWCAEGTVRAKEGRPARSARPGPRRKKNPDADETRRTAAGPRFRVQVGATFVLAQAISRAGESGLQEGIGEPAERGRTDTPRRSRIGSQQNRTAHLRWKAGLAGASQGGDGRGLGGQGCPATGLRAAKDQPDCGRGRRASAVRSEGARRTTIRSRACPRPPCRCATIFFPSARPAVQEVTGEADSADVGGVRKWCTIRWISQQGPGGKVKLNTALPSASGTARQAGGSHVAAPGSR